MLTLAHLAILFQRLEFLHHVADATRSEIEAIEKILIDNRIPDDFYFEGIERSFYGD